MSNSAPRPPILFFAINWGSEHLPFEVFLDRVVDAGFDGVEMSLPLDVAQRASMAAAMRARGLAWIGQHWETATPDFERHCIEYRQRLLNLAAERPLFINSQTGKDYYSFEQNAALFEIAAGVTAETGVQVVHETHRGKFSFAAHVTADYLARLPELTLCLDISHWCCVAETLLEDQAAAVDLALARSAHIHARVGHAQGAQVGHPGAPEWQDAVERHLGWWEAIAARFAAQGRTLTITPEFGPYPYLPRLPYTRQPVADQWEINVGMKDLLARRLGHGQTE